MLKKIFNRERKNTELINDKSTLIAAILIHAAKIDDNYSSNEKEIIKKALIDLKMTTLDKSEELLKQAEIKEKESNQILEFSKEIKKNSMEFRLRIIEILLKIVYSDKSSDIYESNLMRRICGLLYVSDKDSGMIKLKVKNLTK